VNLLLTLKACIGRFQIRQFTSLFIQSIHKIMRNENSVKCHNRSYNVSPVYYLTCQHTPAVQPSYGLLCVASRPGAAWQQSLHHAGAAHRAAAAANDDVHATQPLRSRVGASSPPTSVPAK
jgi:hypothetical protein